MNKTIQSSALLFVSLVTLTLALTVTTPSTEAQVAQQRKVIHGAIPLDKEYWKFNRWYRNHSVLDVIVNGNDKAHLQSVLAEIEKLDKKDVLIRDIIVTGGGHFGQLDRSARRHTYLGIPAGKLKPVKGMKSRKMPALAKIADRISLSDGKSDSRAKHLAKTLKLEFSPSWIISYRGKAYVYEGAQNISKQFSRSGQFRPSGE